MVVLVNNATYPRTKLGRLQWFALHFPKVKDQHALVRLATNPERVVPDINERITAITLILEKGIKYDDEVKPLLDLVKDETDFPIKTGDKDSKENYALLRGEAALALATYGLRSREFTQALIEILNCMLYDPVFVSKKSQASTYFNNFLDALTIADRDSADWFIKITEAHTH